MAEEKVKDTAEQVTEDQNTEKAAEQSAKQEPKTEKKDIAKLKAENKKLTAELDKAADAYVKLQNDLSEEKDKYLRMLAEYDNFRRRTQKDRENTYADAYTEALGELLPVIDNIERSLTFANSDSFEDGVKIIINQVNSAMEKLGIETFGAVGETFDPTLHNAVLHVDDDTLGENVIADVFQKGYKKGDRIIRYAMVKVAN
ncbi:MAG: nucleotide exchange factor GrpE [Clostridia bacterium]|nr:nucleotide exchange factor GrpE [Clostridia bacterium]